MTKPGFVEKRMKIKAEYDKNRKTVIVAGITRSGLTMTMQLLDVGGYPVVGTYPMYEDMGFMAKWNPEWNGKAVKLVDTHLHFPPEGEYSVIRLMRDPEQQLKSMVQFLEKSGHPTTRKQRRALLKSTYMDYKKIDRWVRKQKEHLYIDFAYIINNPVLASMRIQSFVEYPLDINKMSKRVVKRSPDCHDGLLELTMI